MNTLAFPLPTESKTEKFELQQGSKAHIRAYFEDSGPDYRAWSENYNMHFGYANKETGLFNREKMLEQMNQEVADRLQLMDFGSWHIGDFGCGMGATAAAVGDRFPHSEINGLTIVPWQVQLGNALVRKRGIQNVRLHLSDISTPLFPTKSLDAAYAVESFCYGNGLNKDNFIKGMSDSLKHGGRFVIVDGFTIKPKNKFCAPFRAIYNTVCKNWALTDFANIDEFKNSLKKHNLKLEKIEDASFRVAPSALQVPYVTLKFLYDSIQKGDRLSQLRWGHLKACVCGLLMGMFRNQFRYYIITGRKL
jgi:cyclopropane fatty-acyl-phospholipid synthase-like methyltransferase